MFVVLGVWVEHCAECFSKLSIDWLEKVLEVDWFEAAQQICAVCVLVHIEHVKPFSKCRRKFLDDGRLSSSCFTNEQHWLLDDNRCCDLLEESYS